MRAAIALDPRYFGRGRIYLTELATMVRPSPAMVDDFKLFATTYVSGFAAVALYFA